LKRVNLRRKWSTIPKAGRIWAASEPWILGGESGLQDAHRDDVKRFVVRADEKLTAFLDLESAIGRKFSRA
jgi:hypothetical protein